MTANVVPLPDDSRDEDPQKPPCDIPAEMALLGSVLMAGKLERTAARLSADEFYRPVHAEVFDAIQALTNRGLETDSASVSRELADRGSLGRTVAGHYLITLLEHAFPASIAQHSAAIRDAAVRRRTFEFSARVAQLATHRAVGVDAAGIVEKLRAELDQIAAGAATGRRSTVELGDLLRSRVLAYDHPVPPGLSTGWDEVDERLGGGVGMQPGRVYVVGARTGTGKTLVAINLAVAAAHAGTRVALFTLEMNHDEVGDRIVSQAADISLSRLQAHRLTPSDRLALSKLVDRFGGDPMTIDDSAGTTLAGIRAACRDMTRMAPPLGLVVVDYLQLVDPADRKAPRQEQVSAISRGLKVLAKELRVPVVSLAQLNREVESRPDKTPRLSDLRESGSLEQDADVVMLLHRPDDDPSYLHVLIAKNRSGPAGIEVKLDWAPSTARLGRKREIA